MSDHGILFSAEIVCALLARRKRVTRRMSKRWLKVKAGDTLWVRETFQPIFADGVSYAGADWETGKGYALVYPATQPRVEYMDANTDTLTDRCKPSIHMPRWASRITLIATEDAREERLQDITEEDAVAEGCGASEVSESDIADMQISDHHPELKALSRALGTGQFTAKFDYMMLWDSLHGKDAPWSSNPTVIRLAFDYPEAATNDR